MIQNAIATRDSPMYVGLSAVHRLWIIGGAVAVVSLSLLFSAVIMFNMMGSIPLNVSDQQAAINMSNNIPDGMHQAILRAHAIDAIANLKLVANKQGIILVAFSAAMALGAIGFALFILGADGAFTLNAQSGGGGNSSKLVFSGTAPGLLCMLLAAILIGMGIAHRSRLDLGSVSFPATYAGQGTPVMTLSPPHEVDERRALEALGKLSGGAKPAAKGATP